MNSSSSSANGAAIVHHASSVSRPAVYCKWWKSWQLFHFSVWEITSIFFFQAKWVAPGMGCRMEITWVEPLGLAPRGCALAILIPYKDLVPAILALHLSLLFPSDNKTVRRVEECRLRNRRLVVLPCTLRLHPWKVCIIESYLVRSQKFLILVAFRHHPEAWRSSALQKLNMPSFFATKL